ncbi:MAG: PA0069 family radical SAM protein, partial [Proteobacteria bacterium]|nr:PA0069 family radical SAM protein [Pseudomonadota bacterium]
PSTAPPKPASRGALTQPTNRFVGTALERDEEFDPAEEPLPRTQFLPDHSLTAIAYNDSPDIGFRTSLNPYRGCEHGCIYCYARPTHEYLGFSSGLDFETRIMVKERAPELLRAELSAAKWQPQTIAMSGVTDCYQPVERKLELTRRCLAVLAEFRNPVGIVTKNRLVTRDLDLLQELARHQAVVVFISLTTLDPELRRVMEPRTSPPAARLATIADLARAGIPVGVLTAPMIPGLNDHELPHLLGAAAEAGAQFAGYVALRLPYQNKALFEQWLDQHFPLRKDKVLAGIRDLRDGDLNNAEFGTRMRGSGRRADQLEKLFEIGCRKAGLNQTELHLSTAAFRRPGGVQMEML